MLRTKVERPNEEGVDALDGRDLLDALKGFLGLDLDNGEEGVVGLVQVFSQGGVGLKAFEGDEGAEAATTLRRELGFNNQLLCLCNGAD